MENQLTQKERVQEQLAAIAVDVTETDRKEFMEEFDFSVTLVSNYLNGKVASVDTAVVMLTFFRKKIAAREKLLSA